MFPEGDFLQGETHNTSRISSKQEGKKAIEDLRVSLDLGKQPNTIKGIASLPLVFSLIFLGFQLYSLVCQNRDHEAPKHSLDEVYVGLDISNSLVSSVYLARSD